MVGPRPWPQLAEEIRRDNRSGATALLRRAAEALRSAAETLPTDAEDASAWRAALVDAARAIASVRPPFAGLVALASASLVALDAAADPADARRRVVRAVEAVLARADADAAGVVERAATLLGGLARSPNTQHPAPATLLTISASSLVERTILAAARRGPLAVVCLESRPAGEGVMLAERLAAAGCRITLAVDAAGPRLVGEAGAVLLGCDTLAPGGLVHKVGTLGLALAARRLGVPVYALSGPEKLLPAPVRGALADGGPPEEPFAPISPGLTAGAGPGLTVANPYFDLTPLDLVTGVVLPDSVLDPVEAGRRAAGRTVHPALADLLER